MPKTLHIDIETYSSVDLKTSGVYKYVESPDFEILMIAFAFDDLPVAMIDLSEINGIPEDFAQWLLNPDVIKKAHNATFERLCFQRRGYMIPPEQWDCTMVKAAYCGLPLSLDMAGKALGLGEDKTKLATGKALIRYFSQPCKPTKVNGGRTRNLPHHNPEKWEQYKEYCMQDVESERAIDHKLSAYQIPFDEKNLYCLDQKINDNGVLIDTNLAQCAVKINEDYSKLIGDKVKALTGVANPNSLAQLKTWISEATGKECKSLAKDSLSELLEQTDNEAVRELLRYRQLLGKTSVKKYTAMLNCQTKDGHGHGFFQFYGANRTGRWAGRLVQLQNLTKNYIPDLADARKLTKTGNYLALGLIYGDVNDILSQLIRTAFIAPENKTFAVADFSAIEARVTAWLAGEQWRLDVFKSHGKIYEASAANMFNVPIEQITKGSELRQKGKVAELALGYQGSVGALKTMGGESMGLSEDEMQDIVDRWRRASPNIVQLWRDLEGCAKRAITTRQPVKSKHRGLIFHCNGAVLTIQLPSGRKLFYQKPEIKRKTVRKANGEHFETDSIIYWGMEQTRKTWTRLDTYGGKLTENIVQAISRDLLALAMLRLDDHYKIVMHVHDEVVIELDRTPYATQLGIIEQIMSQVAPWALDLPLSADGYLTDFYKKD